MEGYAEFRVVLTEFGPTEDGSFFTTDIELEYHRCTDEWASERFLFKNEIRQKEVQALYCIDHPEELNLYGSPNDVAASMLLIKLNKCNITTTVCKDDVEIDDFK